MRPRSLRDSWQGGKAARWDHESLLLVRLPCSLPNNWNCFLTTRPQPFWLISVQFLIAAMEISTHTERDRVTSFLPPAVASRCSYSTDTPVRAGADLPLQDHPSADPPLSLQPHWPCLGLVSPVAGVGGGRSPPTKSLLRPLPPPAHSSLPLTWSP